MLVPKYDQKKCVCNYTTISSKGLNWICDNEEKGKSYKGGSLRRQSIHASSSLFFKVWLWWIISANLTNTGHSLLQKPHPSKKHIFNSNSHGYSFMRMWSEMCVCRFYIRTRKSIVDKNIFWWVQNNFVKVVCVEGRDMWIWVWCFSWPTKSSQRRKFQFLSVQQKKTKKCLTDKVSICQQNNLHKNAINCLQPVFDSVGIYSDNPEIFMSFRSLLFIGSKRECNFLMKIIITLWTSIMTAVCPSTETNPNRFLRETYFLL